MKKIYVDVSILKVNLHLTGIQRVTREVLIRLYEFQSFQLLLVEYHEEKGKFKIIDTHQFLKRFQKDLKRLQDKNNEKYIGIEEIEQDAIFFELDATWLGNVKRSYLLAELKKRNVTVVAHVYDVLPITYPQYFQAKTVYAFMDYIGAQLLYADCIIVNAETTKQAILDLCERLERKAPKIYVNYLGVDQKEQHLSTENIVREELVNSIKSDKVILMVGTIEPRKNHKLLLKAYDEGLKELGYTIMIAGAVGWKTEELMTTIREHEDYGKHIFHFTNLNDQEIAYLYKKAKFVAFLSYAEGFGLPIIEALQHKTPVIASATPINQEVGKHYCDYFTQDRAKELCEIVLKYEENPQLYEDKIRGIEEFKSDSWQESAENIKGILESI